MKKVSLILVWVLTALSGNAWDNAIMSHRLPDSTVNSTPEKLPGQIELYYDTGIPYVIVTFENGADMWVGNDFNTSEYGSFPYINKIRWYCYDAWPNVGFDGSYLAIFAMVGGIPGSVIWPTDGYPIWIVPSENGFQDFTVGWQITTHTFLVANNQFNDFPDCDPFLVDNNPTDKNHSWVASGSTWQRFKNNSGLQETLNGYNNLMMRLIITPENSIETGSIGKIKALYR